MAMNKKQKKQLDALKTKHVRLQQVLSAAKQQPDDPEEVPNLQSEIADLESQMKKIREG